LEKAKQNVLHIDRKENYMGSKEEAVGKPQRLQNVSDIDRLE